MPYTISSSKVASIISGEKMESDPIRAELGKLFEEGYQEACWYLQILDEYDEFYEDEFVDYVVSYINDRMDNILEDDDNEIMDITLEFYRAGMVGKIPKTTFRELHDNYYIAAKPDLITNFSEKIYEFKIYNPGEFAITQCKIFAWVFQKPITLVGWDSELKKPVIKEIPYEEIKFPKLDEDLFTETDWDRIHNTRKTRNRFKVGNFLRYIYQDDDYYGFDDDYDLYGGDYNSYDPW